MKEKKYPMTYKEYEKRVIELFLETGNYATKEEKDRKSTRLNSSH